MINKKIFFMEIEEIKKLIREKLIKVTVIGIGRIGLPTALSFANSGLETTGMDVNVKLVNSIKNMVFPLRDEPGYEEIFFDVISKKKFSATDNFGNAIKDSDIILLSLPTPMDKENIPDYSALELVANQIKEALYSGSVIIIESTVEPGFIENKFIKILENNERKLIAGKDFGVGVCPETANPGEIMKDFNQLPRLVGGFDEKTRDIIIEIYSHVFSVDLIKMPDCKTANAVKLTTNVFRDVNIAFVNELALLFEKLGIDIKTVLDAADRKYNFQIHFPGAGVGGPCLPVNSYQMLNSAKGVDNNLLKIVKTSREINEYMPHHVIQLTNDALNEAGKQIGTSNILILGISYKPNVKDIQLSPAEIIISELKKIGATVKIFDPYFKDTAIYGIQTEKNLEQITLVDAVIIVTAHKEFEKIKPEYFVSKMNSPVIIDTRGIIDMQEANKIGLIFRGLGRGSK